jgi:hypothetical protein
MSDIGIRVSRAAMDLFRANEGLPGMVSALSTAADVKALTFGADQVQLLNVAPELAEKASVARYPLVHLYTERVTNQLREKFRRFSGKVWLVAEVRISQSHLDGIERASQLLADAVTEVLDANRGAWGNGMYFAGGYEIAYGPVKQGGKNFIQLTKVTFEVDVSSD